MDTVFSRNTSGSPFLMTCTIPELGSMIGVLRVLGAGSTENLDSTAARPAKDCIKPIRAPEIDQNNIRYRNYKDTMTNERSDYNKFENYNKSSNSSIILKTEFFGCLTLFGNNKLSNSDRPINKNGSPIQARGPSLNTRICFGSNQISLDRISLVETLLDL